MTPIDFIWLALIGGATGYLLLRSVKCGKSPCGTCGGCGVSAAHCPSSVRASMASGVESVQPITLKRYRQADAPQDQDR